MKEPAQRFAEIGGRLARGLGPEVQVRIRLALMALAGVWALASVADLVWTALPSSQLAPLPAVVNPPQPVTDGQTAVEVDLDNMLGLGLFGTPSAQSPDSSSNAAGGNLSESIEQGAEETRLDLTLVGTLAESGSERGTAVIEVKGQQRTFAVGDRLPIGTAVNLAKVLSTRVVLDNNGTYELLTLFDEALEVGTINPNKSAAAVTGFKDGGAVDGTGREPVVRDGLAARYRQRLYDNPRSLAGLVQVSPVQGPEGLRGYRVAPGKNAREFQALGFESGDIVVAVNGLPLSNASNAARLYDMMREASEATFDVERGGATVTLSVSLSPEQER